jgi:uncharacterized damage-inducible protein DinB
MTSAELLLHDFEIETSNTRRTLERIPEENPDYKPHEKSMPLGRLAMHCATLPLFGYYILADDDMDLAASKRQHSDLTFQSRAHCLQTFEESVKTCRESLAGASDEDLEAIWKFSWGEHIISNNPRSITFRQLFMHHMVHHVAQLGVYLRLNNLPVPSLYGPSADEQWSPK